MPAESWETLQSDKDIARQGLISQANAHIPDCIRIMPDLMPFIDHQTEVLASKEAEIRWLRNILNRSLNDGTALEKSSAQLEAKLERLEEGINAALEHLEDDYEETHIEVSCATLILKRAINDDK